MKIFRHIPFFLYVLIVYNALAFSGTEIETVLNVKFFEKALISGAILTIGMKDVLVIIGVISLYIEILKSTRTSAFSVIDHALSLLVFVAFLAEFITVKNAGTSVFLVLTLMSLLDVIAGFTVTLSSARRDVSVIRE